MLGVDTDAARSCAAHGAQEGSFIAVSGRKDGICGRALFLPSFSARDRNTMSVIFQIQGRPDMNKQGWKRTNSFSSANFANS